MKIDWELRQADKGWLGLLTFIVVYELTCDDGELLSHGASRYRAAHPVLTTSVVVVTAAHLLELIPDRVDPFSALFRWLNAATKPTTPP